MAVTHDGILAQRLAEHVNPANRWCAVGANYPPPIAALATALRRPTLDARLFAVAKVVLAAGRAVEGNLQQEFWAAPSDVAVANATIKKALRGRGGAPG